MFRQYIQKGWFCGSSYLLYGILSGTFMMVMRSSYLCFNPHSGYHCEDASVDCHFCTTDVHNSNLITSISTVSNTLILVVLSYYSSSVMTGTVHQLTVILSIPGALARGDAAILLRFPQKGYREKIWDHAAGAIIVQEAGALITDASGDCL